MSYSKSLMSMIVASLVFQAFSLEVLPQKKMIMNICPSNISHCYGNFREYIAKPMNIDAFVNGNENQTYYHLKNTIKFYNLKMNSLFSVNGGNKKSRRKARKLLSRTHYIEKASSSIEIEHLGVNICDINYYDIQLENIKDKYSKIKELNNNITDLNKSKLFFGYFVAVYIFSVFLCYKDHY